MDSIPHTSRPSHAEVHGGKVPQISRQQPRVANLANKVDTRSRSIFHRALLWIKGWVQPRAKMSAINRALAPFIKAAKADSRCVISIEHLNKLESMLADSSNPHAIPLVAETVPDNIKLLNLVGLKRLKSSLGQLASSETLLGKTLLDTVDRRINDVQINEAKYRLSNALGVFSEMSAKTSEPDFLVSVIQSDLLTILDLVEPTERIAAETEGSASQRITFESASSVMTLQALRTWFDGHSPAQQLRVKTNFWSVAYDYSLVRDGAKADQAVFAFCRSVTTLLWPEDPRHAYFKN
jgi:hypothetical protein